MKKILTMILLAMLVAFTGCDGGSSSSAASDDEQAMAEEFAQAIALTMAGSTSDLVAPSGVANGDSRAVSSPDDTNITVDPAAKTFSGYFTMSYDNVVSGDVTMNGYLTYTVSGSWNDAGSVTAEGALTGTLTVTSGTEIYEFVFAINMSQSGNTATVSGYIKVNGAKATISETVTSY